MRKRGSEFILLLLPAVSKCIHAVFRMLFKSCVAIVVKIVGLSGVSDLTRYVFFFHEMCTLKRAGVTLEQGKTELRWMSVAARTDNILTGPYLFTNPLLCSSIWPTLVRRCADEPKSVT